MREGIRIISFVFVLSIQLCSGQETSPVLYGAYFDYKKGDTAYIFSSKSTLFQKASESSKKLKELQLGDMLIMDATVEVDYGETYKTPSFYRVNCKGKVGFVRSDDLAIAAYVYPEHEMKLLFRFQRGSDFGMDSLFWKEVYGEQLFNLSGIQLNSVPFSFYRSGNRGLEGIENLFYIDFLSEACGMQGGVEIYTWTPGEFNQLALLNEVGDGGVFYLVEKLILPEDSTGVPGFVLFESEEEFVYDDATEWRQVKQTYRKFKWVDGGLEPKFHTDPDQQEPGE